MKPLNLSMAAQAAHDLSFILQCQYVLHLHQPDECLNSYSVDDLEDRLAHFADLLGYDLVKPEDVAAPDYDWISWSGGECPVHMWNIVEIEGRVGRRKKGYADDFRWPHSGRDDDIMRYRIVKGGEA